MINFVRMTKLTNVAGRADYISNPDRQENILVASDSIDWKPYQNYEKSDRKGMCENIQARELIISLPNQWEKLNRLQLINHAQNIAVKAIGKNTDMQWAVHRNKTKTNLHLHVIFSERKLLSYNKTQKTYDRDVYLTADGKVARKKSDRAKDQHGNTLPPVHRKGEKKGVVCEFTVKDVKYKSKAWLESAKTALKDHFQSLGVKIDKNGILHQYHEGKGKESSAIRRKNIIIKSINQFLDNTAKTTPLSPEHIKKIKKDVLNIFKSGNFPILTRSGTRLGIFSLTEEEYDLFRQGKLKLPQPKPTQSVEPAKQTSPTSISRSNTINNQVTPTPPPAHHIEPFDPTDIVKARNIYAETYMKYAYKTEINIDNDKIKRVDSLKQAIDQLVKQSVEVKIAYNSFNNCRFWQKEKKKQLQAEHENEVDKFKELIQTIERNGVSVYLDSQRINCHYPEPDVVNEIIRRAIKHRIPELEKAAAGERAKTEKFNKIRHIKYKDAQGAYNDFVDKLSKIMPEHRKDAYTALQSPYRGDFHVEVFGNRNINQEISAIVEKRLNPKAIIPSKTQDEPTQQHTYKPKIR